MSVSQFLNIFGSRRPKRAHVGLFVAVTFYSRDIFRDISISVRDELIITRDFIYVRITRVVEERAHEQNDRINSIHSKNPVFRTSQVYKETFHSRCSDKPHKYGILPSFASSPILLLRYLPKVLGSSPPPHTAHIPYSITSHTRHLFLPLCCTHNTRLMYF